MLLYCEECGTVVRKSYEAVRKLKVELFKGSPQLGYRFPCRTCQANVMDGHSQMIFTALSSIDLND